MNENALNHDHCRELLSRVRQQAAWGLARDIPMGEALHKVLQIIDEEGVNYAKEALALCRTKERG